MALLLLHLRVRDYGAWKPMFDERGRELRKEHGATRHWLYRSVSDPNELVVSTEFPSAQAAQGFVDDPSLKEAMDRAGVEGPPKLAWIGDEVESIQY